MSRTDYPMNPWLELLGIGLCAAALADVSAAGSDVLYASDFEDDDGGLVEGFPGSDWEHGTPAAGSITAHSGVKCWGTQLAGPASESQLSVLITSPIDASPAAEADGLGVSWWQLVDDVGIHVSSVTARAGGATQQLAGLVRIFGSTDLPQAGWRHMRVVLGREYATPDLTLEWRFEAGSGGTHGYYVDDISVEVLRATSTQLDDFESGPGGFAGVGAWEHGAPSGCPVPVAAASGSFCWGTSLHECTYPALADDALLSPVIDLAPYANRREVYLRWSRFVSTESVFDGVHHELSYDGGGTWEASAGFHGSAADGLFGWTGFGIAVDPARASSVRLRWRLTSDMTDQEYGAWLDDFELAVPKVVAGSGANPTGSLLVTAGAIELGASARLELDDPSGRFPAPALGILFLALGPDPQLPEGTALPGLGLAGSVGDLLIDPTTLVATEIGTVWSAGAPSRVRLVLPASPELVGTQVWLQGALVSLNPPSVGLTVGLFEQL